ncbi:BREX-1 system phosphatase PglZ type A [Endozoicomonas sp. ONNA2]|uniref:BREX-1 system phosphatase PglZ type A n=1 Tax=Endozoicomonas sp. ONNA2 TaxID=2828741 RepID=UPI0021481B24|nr:BREX-1 system phosphatase PglZ type A [Endozoicomonas sp. ONNA2]
MQISELAQGISARFEKSRIVFWYDPEESFTEELEQLSTPDSGLPDGVRVLNMGQESVLATKKRMEMDEPAARFLLYFPYMEPEPEQDWLLDIRLYSEQFYADHSSMLLNELGIPRMSLRGHIRQRQSFFASKQRMAQLKKWVTESEDERSLDRKMMAVVSKADSAELSDILFSLLREYAGTLVGAEDEPDAVSEYPLFQQIGKFQLEPALWALLSEAYGYTVEQPSFGDFVLKLFCTEFWSQIEGGERDWLLNNVMKTASGRSTALALMGSWRDSRAYAADYERIATVLAKKLEVADRCRQFQPMQLVECETFEAVEQAIIRGLVNDLLDSGKLPDRSLFESLLSRRLQSYWAQPSARNGREYQAIYQALRAAEQLLHLRHRFVDGFHFGSQFDNAKALYNGYVEELYQFDQAYRLFNEHVLSVMSKGADILRALDDAVENLYTQWFLPELGLAWDRHLSGESLLDKWQLSGVPRQNDFYDREVKARLKSKKAKRVFVIISDALRYEIARELGDTINQEKRFKAELATQLGVLPSYTQLGMAALLPHQQLSYQATEGGAAVLADGRSTQGLENRNALLQSVNGMAVTAKELMGWSNQEGRERVRQAEVVYIYHDTIDAIGDKAGTEEKTFEACRLAVSELKDLVGRVINRLNGSQVVITADHGFLFQQKALTANDRTVLHSKPGGTIEAKKRYIVGDQLPADDNCWHGRLSVTAGGDPSSSRGTEFLLPRGNQRFHFVGGARFVHGGAMLQEICLPVLTVRELHKAQAASHEKKPVEVLVASQPIRLVNNIDKIRLIQTEPVGGQFIPRQLDIMVVDAAGNAVSSRETLTFDSTGTALDDRVREVRLKLIGSSFSRTDSYFLLLENVETHTTYAKYNVTIDLAFQDDFF